MYPRRLKVVFAKGDEAILIQLGENVYCCPVCGSTEVDLPYSSNGSASYEICPDCGIEYGFDDEVSNKKLVDGYTHEKKWQELRAQWLAGKEVTETLRERLLRIGVAL